MNDSTLSFAHVCVVPSVCDAEAGEAHRSHVMASPMHPTPGNGSSPDSKGEEVVPTQTRSSAAGLGLSVRTLRAVMSELCLALRSALDDERGTAEDSLRRAAEFLRTMGEAEVTPKEEVRGGLSPWQIRKVTNYIEAHLNRSIRNEDLATIVRLNQSYFGRAFRSSFGEPPHEYVIRRRVERAQGLMLSTDAPLSDIALECGLSDQAHLCRLFRRIVGQSPGGWRRARIGAPAECVPVECV